MNKALTAALTAERMNPRSAVGPNVCFKGMFVGEYFRAGVTGKHFHFGVRPHVNSESVFHPECFTANLKNDHCYELSSGRVRRKMSLICLYMF
jgi:hypothetical protein